MTQASINDRLAATPQPDSTYLERSFQGLVRALDDLPETESRDFLARLALILAEEMRDADRFIDAVQRAKSAQPQEAK